ncbi:DNA (cytosine-5-)-methyltransferase [Peptoniphilus sp. MSJ-1]|uniref:DNA (cytosine-5-)-methyltransferase n=1 Tax=Peptoniphilus ovalis TaxID=2841503 RepID=A0ABS6FHA5_9FIRM|nr:DNA (cytosine-5-)-methyltransferase [Peptoniphilus ovalis]MBU5669550.1 DNA (cytosine-5-)-methyltransferase [Peptoniphilus ovalis]
MKFLDVFSGIGGFRMGLEQAGHTCIGHIEKDKYALASYKAIYDIKEDEYEGKDVTEIEDFTELKGKYDLLVGGFPCFSGDTLVTTITGVKPIKDIKVGERVLTHNSKFKEVLNVWKKESDDLYKIKYQGSDGLRVTGNHKLYVRSKTENGFTDAYWKECKDLDTDLDYLIVPSIKNAIGKSVQHISLEEAWILGRYAADGYIQDNKRTDSNTYNNKIVLCIGKSKIKDLEHIKEYHYTISKQRTVYKVILCSERLKNLAYNIGKGSANKKAGFMFTQSIEIIKEFLKGYYAGDGYLKDNKVKCSSVSKRLIYDISILHSIAYNSSFSISNFIPPKKKIIEGREVNQNPYWIFSSRIDSDSKGHMLEIEGEIWTKLKSKERIYNTHKVYDLEVKDEHTYTVNNIGVHNCQSFSIAGHRKGFNDTRGTMFFYLAKILEQTKPSFFLFENVKGLLSHDKGDTFEVILNTLDELGYNTSWNLFNSKDFGVPQNRERVYITGYLRGRGGREIFPIRQTSGKDYGNEYTNTVPTRFRGSGGETYIKSEQKIKQIGKFIQSSRKSPSRYRVFDETGISPTITTAQGGGLNPHIIDKGNNNTNKNKIISVGGGKSQGNKVYSPKGLSVTLSANGGGQGAKTGLYAIPIITPNRLKKRQHGRRYKTNGEPMFTLTAQDQHGVIINNKQKELGYRIRRLTPKECWRLQGFPDWAFERAKAIGTSDTQLYKQAGNAVTVNVVKAIGEEFKKMEKEIKNDSK